MGPHIDLHMGFHKGKMIPIPNGHRKLGIPMPMPNFVIRLVQHFCRKGPAPNSHQVFPKFGPIITCI